ncbi:MAG: YwaF family protein [Clostridia bacterium]|nr:YwaF family protein [Clostridia bacterium]MBP5270964.1 YwaF family protein [Clostridia bacterium]
MAIIRPFNGTFFILLAIFILFTVGYWALFRKTSEKTRLLAVVGLYAAAFVFFWLYKYWISIDIDYSEITREAGEGAFSWWKELPLHLCNINLLLVPIAALTGNRYLLSFTFFMAPFGAIMAMAMPGVGFSGYSLFVPRVMGYYVTHMLVLIISPILVLFGLYRPKFKDIPMTLVYAVGISLVVFVINMALRLTHTEDYANYFYTIDPPAGTPLVLFKKWIPVPFLYDLPIFPVLAGYMALVTLPFHLADRKKVKEEAVAGEEAAV